MQPLINPQHIANVQIGLLSEIEHDEDKKNHHSNHPLPFSFLFYVESLFRKLGCPISQTEECKHRSGCIPSAIASSLKAGFIGYFIKSGIALVFSLKSIIKKPSKLITSLGSKDSLRFGGFGFLFAIVFRSLVCFLRRRIDKKHAKYIFLIAGSIAGTLSVIVLQKKTRQTYALFLLARALDSIYQTLVRKKILPEFKYYYVFLYALMMFVTGGLAYGSEPIAIPTDLNKFYNLFINESFSENQMRRIWVERKNNILSLKGIPKYNPADYMPGLKEGYRKMGK